MPVDKKVSELDEADPDGSEIVFKVVQDGVDKKLTRTATGEGVISVFSRTTELTNDQIKALPTTAVELVPAPGAGNMIKIYGAVAVLDTTAGGYTEADASWAIVTADAYEYLSCPVPVGDTFNGTGVFGYHFPAPNILLGTGNFLDSPIGLRQNNAALDNKAVAIADDWNGVSNYTGGNAANTLKVTVLYSIIDVS